MTRPAGRPGLLPDGALDPVVFPYLAVAEAAADGFTAGYTLGGQIGWEAGYAAALNEQDTRWSTMAAGVRRRAGSPTHAELQRRRGEPEPPPRTPD
jgi:hypothetical protein